MNRPFTWGDAGRATPRDDRAGAQPSARCYLCGIVLPTGLMVPDGGQACADIRWYCQDTRACTERWTAHPSRRAHLAPNPAPPPTPAGPREGSPPSGELRPGERPDPSASGIAGPGARSDVVERPALASYQKRLEGPLASRLHSRHGPDRTPASRYAALTRSVSAAAPHAGGAFSFPGEKEESRWTAVRRRSGTTHGWPTRSS